jgi:predicted PurR-regulated permease PerM
MVKFVSSWPRWLSIGLALPLVILNGWVLLLLMNYFSDVVTQLVLAIVLAFVLEYPVEFLQRLKIPRITAILVVLLVAILVFIVLGLTLVPTLLGQVNDFANRLPTWVDSSSEQLQVFQTWAETRNLPIDISKLIIQLEGKLSTQLQQITGQVLGVVLNTITSIFGLVLTLVLTFNLLLHGQRLWEGIFRWFPPEGGSKIRQIFRQNFQNYFVGQATLALLMGSAMTIAFVLIQLPFGLLFGLGIGILTLFPFGAAFGIVVVSVLTSLKSIWLGFNVLAIATVIDQLVENGIAPQLIGGFTGLNPVWILVSLLVGTKIGGLLGLLIAVPLASTIKSITDEFVPAPQGNRIKNS